jgi:RHS repeat-associated protein
MARTAPIPNIPAIPGMNPGVFILGGGGGAGGSGPGNGKGNGQDQGAGGSNGGDDANGGGKNASGCGPGNTGGCPNPAHGGGGTAAGDPVDIVTGRVYTEPVVDFALRGPLPLVIERAYSSTARDRDVGLGFGWTHSLAWEVEQRRRTVRVWRPEGTFMPGPRPAQGSPVVLEEGARLARDAQGYTLLTSDGRRRIFTAAPGAEGRFILSSIVDRNGNSVQLSYREGLLDTITDSAGRAVRVRRHADGHIAAFEVKNAAGQGRWIAYRTYQYDSEGDLIAATDAEGHSSRFAYEDHRMTSRWYPAGLRVNYRYDAQGRCIETWGEHPSGVDPSLAADVPALLADSTTRAKGVHHCKLDYGGDGYTEVVDSRQVRRYFGNALGKVDKVAWGSGVQTSAFDEHGNLTGYTDALGASWSWVLDALGNVLRAIDPLGAVTEYRYDEAGNRVEIIDALGVSTNYAYDARGNLLFVADGMGDVVRYAYDRRGLLVEATLPNGGRTRIQRDDQGNPAEVTEPDGSTKRIRHDYLGRVQSMIDEIGMERRYVYSARGEVVAVHLPDGGVYAFAYDPDGRLSRLTDPDGRTWELFWGGLGAVHTLRKPDGQSIQYRYDREGSLVLVQNERGEEHHILRDVAGRIKEERTFDGRRVLYQMDANGRITQIENGNRQKIELVYDPCGRLLERRYADDTKDVFEYDLSGRMIAAENEAVRCSFTYDERGRRTQEVQAFGGAVFAIDSGYDALGKRRSKRTSLGYVETVEHDLMGQPARMLLGGVDALSFRWDARGFEVERGLPDGGRIQSDVDALGRVTRRRVMKAVTDPSVGAREPDWVGRRPIGLTSDRAYAYSKGGELLEEWDLDAGRTQYRYDPLGQVLSRLPEHASGEIYAYDEAQNVFERGASAEPREYASGGKLIKRGNAVYDYDGDARLVRKRLTGADGQVATWTYTWSARGLLTSVKTPGGEVVDIVYDAFARRVMKRIVRDDRVTSVRRFVWDDEALAHEIHEAASASGDPVVQQRTYCFRPGTVYPLAHVDAVPDGSRSLREEWAHYVNDRTERPSLLVSGDGEILARLETTVWGRASGSAGAKASTPLRYPGQYEDAETGLSYNRFRYYDPEVGRYISADPIGLEGGLRPTGYANNQPLLVVDPEGLDPVIATVSGSSGTFKRGSQKSSVEQGGGKNPKLHPIVDQSLPPAVNKQYPGGPDPTSCGEPRALTAYIEQWEIDNRGGKSLDPDNPEDHADIRKCMGSITSMSAENPANGEQKAVPRAPCPNCSQLIANLHSKWGGPNPETVQNGFPALKGEKGNKSGVGSKANFSKPKDESWLKGPIDDGPKQNYQRHEDYGKPV